MSFWLLFQTEITKSLPRTRIAVDFDGILKLGNNFNLHNPKYVLHTKNINTITISELTLRILAIYESVRKIFPDQNCNFFIQTGSDPSIDI